jgi:hypothetical protein
LALSWGWSYDRIYTSDLREFAMCLQGHKITEFERTKVLYEVGRYTASRVLTVHKKKGSIPLDWWSFNWDAKPKTKDDWLKDNKQLIQTWNKLSKAK